MIILNTLRWLHRNVGLLLLSFVLALAVWLTAVVTTDPDVEQPFPRQVPIEYRPPAASLVIVNQLPASAQLTLRAPQSVWDELLSNSDALRIVADLSNLDAGTYQVVPEVHIQAHPVRIQSMAPQRITVVLEPLLSRELPVVTQVNGEPAPGFRALPLVLGHSRVTVRGPQSQVEQVSEARLSLDIEGARADIKTVLPVQLYDAQGQTIDGLDISPTQIQVWQPIQQLGGYRDVAVKVVITGTLAAGYRITNLTVAPPVVTVFSSNPQQIDELPGFVETEMLDLSDAVDDLDKRLALALPEGISVVGDPTVLVHVSIAAIEGSLTLSLPVEVVGLPPDLTATASPDTVDVILSGPLPVLDALSPEDLRVFVDATNLTEGVHQLPPQVEVLRSQVRVETILPATIEVTLAPHPTPTVTPTPGGG